MPRNDKGESHRHDNHTVVARSASDEAVPHNPYCHCEPFGFCHSEGEERPKNLAQGKLREAISVDRVRGGVNPKQIQMTETQNFKHLFGDLDLDIV